MVNDDLLLPSRTGTGEHMNAQVRQILQNYGDNVQAMPDDVAAVYLQHQSGIGQTLRQRHAIASYNEVRRQAIHAVEREQMPREWRQPETSPWRQIVEELTTASACMQIAVAVLFGSGLGAAIAIIWGWA